MLVWLSVSFSNTHKSSTPLLTVWVSMREGKRERGERERKRERESVELLTGSCESLLVDYKEVWHLP